jgi:hypothetical protein
MYETAVERATSDRDAGQGLPALSTSALNSERDYSYVESMAGRPQTVIFKSTAGSCNGPVTSTI